jgi:uncharacterized protein (TIGR03435 family)
MRNRFATILGVWLLLATGAALGQAAGSAPQAPETPAARTLNTKLVFDVATVKPSPPLDMQKLAADMQAGKMPNFGPRVEGLRAQYTYMALKDLIALAYDVKAYQITGPAWLASERFDIVAEMPDGSKKDDAKDMLRSLLEERFKLTVHKETQEHPVYALVVAKGGSKMKESPAPKPIDPDAPLKPGEMKMDTANGPAIVKQGPDGSATVNMGEKGIVTQKMDMANQALQLTSDTVSMQGFADMLTNVMQMGGGGGRQVVDQTGLKGNYQISLEIPMAAMIQAARAAGVDVPGGPGANKNAAEAEDPGGGSTIFESVNALGLRLESTKASVQQLVVDSAEKAPTEN